MAQCSVGLCYYDGMAVAKDAIVAVEWLRKSAAQGNQQSLGLCYENGSGVAKDLKTAAEWYRKAANQGSTWLRGS